MSAPLPPAPVPLFRVGESAPTLSVSDVERLLKAARGTP